MVLGELRLSLGFQSTRKEKSRPLVDSVLPLSVLSLFNIFSSVQRLSDAFFGGGSTLFGHLNRLTAKIISLC